MAGELCHEAVGEGHYMSGWLRWREDGFGRKGFNSRSGGAAKGALRIKVLQGRVRDIGIELIACYVRVKRP